MRLNIMKRICKKTEFQYSFSKQIRKSSEHWNKMSPGIHVRIILDNDKYLSRSIGTLIGGRNKLNVVEPLYLLTVLAIKFIQNSLYIVLVKLSYFICPVIFYRFYIQSIISIHRTCKKRVPLYELNGIRIFL